VTARSTTDPAGADPDRSGGCAAPAHGARTLVLAGVGYLVLAVGLWWNVWSSRPTSTTTCGCGDPARFLWFFEWPAFALAHGHDVWYSTWLFHPGGINLLDDTSVVALGVILAPVTWAFGPVASMNVALTLAPALSALAMFALLRHWVRWTPAALLAGLAYGFSPFVVTELALGQLNIAFLAVPPLVVLVLADLLVTQRRPPWRNGLALAGLVVVQFFVSTEVLVITALASLVGTALLVGWAALSEPSAVASRIRGAARGIGVALGISAVVLAYPLWFLLDGPAHLVGPIWSYGATSRYGTTWSSFVTTGGLSYLRPSMLRFGGYQGPALVGLGYLGPGVLAAAVVGAVVFRRDRRMLLFVGVGLVAAVASLGPGHGYWVPWDVLQHLPWVGDIVEVRFSLVVTLCVAVLAGLTVDQARTRLEVRAPSWAGAASWAVVAVVLVPTVVALAPGLPLTARPVVLPEWFARPGPDLPPGRVVLAYPVPFSGLQSSQAWQAVDAMTWSQAGGGGPQGQPWRAGAARPGFEVLVGASLPLGPAPEPTAANLGAVREALALWKVTTVVVPDQPGLPVYEQGRSPSYAAGLLTAALGTLPAYVDRAWVWSSVATAPAPAPLPTAAFDRCTTGATGSTAPPVAVLSVPECVLGAAAAAPGA
jgi:hypothetical protein